MVSVTLENLTKQYEEIFAVKDLNLKIKDKEFLVLLGPSGCGKTTTLRLICGLEVPTKGRIYLDEKDITYTHPKDRKMSMVFQSYALYPHMTVFDNMAFPLKIMKFAKEEIRKRVKKVAELLEIEHLLDRKPGTLSGGEAQRVALGRAIILEPKVFLMDEPMSNVDAKLRVYLRGEIKKLQRNLQITTVYVTHDQVEAMTMADRVAVMNKGRLQQISRPVELYNNPKTTFVAGFIGSPPMNLIDCSLVEANGKLLLDAGAFTINVSELSDVLRNRTTSSELILGVRPEDISVAQGKVKRKPDFIANVYILEPLGLETIVTIKAGDKLILARAPSDFKANIGDEVGVTLDRQKIYIFDDKTTKRYI